MTRIPQSQADAAALVGCPVTNVQQWAVTTRRVVIVFTRQTLQGVWQTVRALYRRRGPYCFLVTQIIVLEKE